mgnify:CR=1 FL=1
MNQSAVLLGAKRKKIVAPGQGPGVSFSYGPGPLAYPSVLTAQTETTVEVVAAGGLTKLQWLAAHLLTGQIGPESDDECAAKCVNRALRTADLILKATDPQPGGAQS